MGLKSNKLLFFIVLIGKPESDYRVEVFRSGKSCLVHEIFL